jgi:hypothetical protein
MEKASEVVDFPVAFWLSISGSGPGLTLGLGREAAHPMRNLHFDN